MTPARHLSANLRSLRQARGLTQAQAAALAEVPRATWASLESGSANPTLTVLVAVSQALQASIEELLAAPRASARHFPAADLPVKTRGSVEIRNLLPDPLPGVVLERMYFPPGKTLVGVPHTPGTREYLTCERGMLRLTASGSSWELAPGDVVVFRGDQKHAYTNPGDDEAVAYSVVLLAPG